jgi:hypothetical protein
MMFLICRNILALIKNQIIMKKNRFLGSVANFFRLLLNALLFLLYRWIIEVFTLLRENRSAKRRGKYLENLRKRRAKPCAPKCATMTPAVYKRADPLIYSQKYLKEQGLAVTWNNPDIQLFKDGVPVSSSTLEVDTEYQIVATVYNNSTEAPAAGLPVRFSYLDFGIGTTSVGIGDTQINLPVKGAPGHPAKATMTWRTPQAEGHYCLQVLLDWHDDANPKNNLGQENTNVGKFSSPAVFEFSVHNEDTIRKRIQLIPDCYQLPPLPFCKDVKEKSPRTEKERYKSLKALKTFIPPLEEDADWIAARNKHNVENFQIPDDWSVDIEPNVLDLAPGQTQAVKATITPPDQFEGQKTININGLYGNELIGGVTLTATS